MMAEYEFVQPIDMQRTNSMMAEYEFVQPHLYYFI